MMLHVLIVDDEWLDLEGLRDQIPRLLLPPMEIHTAESGIHALQVIQDVPVDILITDVNMPQLSGIDLAGIVKEKYPDAEILFVSGYDDFEYARQALALSAVWYLLKPVQDDELLTALLRAVNRLGAKAAGRRARPCRSPGRNCSQTRCASTCSPTCRNGSPWRISRGSCTIRQTIWGKLYRRCWA